MFGADRSRGIGFALMVAIATSLGTAAAVSAQTEPLEPHSSCDSEPTRISTEGVAEADLTVINHTDATFELYWLDYEGERVYYQDSPPHSSLVQETWLTHPWILTDDDGTCYLLIVTNSLQQTMTIGTTTGEEPVTPVETTLPDQSGDTTPEATNGNTTSSTSVVAASPTGDDGGSFFSPLVIGALAAMGVLVGVMLATGRINLPWTRPDG